MHIENKEERIAQFFAKLDHMLDITARQLHERMEFQKTAYAKQFPLLMSSLWLGSEKLKPNDTIAPVINQGTLGIGFIGLAECLVALTGKHHGEDVASQELGLKIVSYIRNGPISFQRNTCIITAYWQHRPKACRANLPVVTVRNSVRCPVSRTATTIQTPTMYPFITNVAPATRQKWRLPITR